MAQNAQPHWQEPGQRPVTDLVLAEQIVVWTLRRYRAGGERLEGLAGTFRQVFGLGGVEAALAAAEPPPLQADGFECGSACDDEAGRGRPRVLH